MDDACHWLVGWGLRDWFLARVQCGARVCAMTLVALLLACVCGALSFFVSIVALSRQRCVGVSLFQRLVAVWLLVRV